MKTGRAAAERWGGPFDGRVDTLGPIAVYEAPISKVASLGIPFRGGRTLGYYKPDPSTPSWLIWHEAKTQRVSR